MFFWNSLSREERIIWMRVMRHIVERLGGEYRPLRYCALVKA